jgi:RHH-type transcriptional regulator, proline utilization regulon repressor / proline dehydrogenase / delta 1-pyrroline-5-carboxylate dehydrogenase
MIMLERQLPPFHNEPLTDFSVKTNRDRLASALNHTVSSLSKKDICASPLIDGKEIETREVVVRENPSTGEPLGSIRYAGPAEVTAALTSMHTGCCTWNDAPWSDRTECLRRLAQILVRDKDFFNSLIILETGKPWKEADADVAEAVDFCNYYADYAEFLLKKVPLPSPLGEQNYLTYEGKGIAVVIAPWNFPLAIACGMTVAALVTGNTTILKPAEQSSIVAFEFARRVLESGIPADAFAFLPGRGEIIGKLLVESHLVDLICFTGSREVGLHICQAAAEIRPGQRSIKRVIAELGGKNAIIVDEDADLDETIKGVLQSTFGYSGQKCSACSRLIIVETIYDKVVERLVAATSDIVVGDAQDPASFVGPVIDKESQERLLGIIREGGQRLRMAYKGHCPDRGHFVPPTIFRDVVTTDPLWRGELFGPILACARARNFEEALLLATESDFALTGAVFSRNPANLALAERRFKVGNLYLNRGCTGALVGRQPFGGFRFSGIGSKAGGPDYLLQFVDPRAVTENTMRRGFTPELT